MATRRLTFARCSFIVVALLSSVRLATAQIDTMSLAADGTRVQGLEAAISADGRFVVFTSATSNVTDEGQPGTFLRDRALRQTIWIGPGLARAAVSRDGRYILHKPGDDWVVLDRQMGRTDPIPPVGGVVGIPALVLAPALSADGRHVAFYSDIRPPLPGHAMGVFVRNLDTGEVCSAHTGPGGVAGNDHLGFVDNLPPLGVSDNGRVVAFASKASNLVAGDSENTAEGFVHDCVTHLTERIQDRVTGEIPAGVVGATISGDGLVAAITRTQVITARFTFEVTSILVLDRVSGRLSNITFEFGSTSTLSPAMRYPSLSEDGRLVAFLRWGTEMVRYDRVTTRSDVLARSTVPSIFSATTQSHDGSIVAFASDAPELVGESGPVRTTRAFVYHNDLDGDGLPEPWETFFGLDPREPGDRDADPDGDGKTNLQEFSEASHPRGLSSATRWLSEGVNRPSRTDGTLSFQTEIRLANAHASATAHVQLRYLTRSGRVLTERVLVHPTTTRTAFAMPADDEFSTVVESDAPIAVSRELSWGTSGRDYDGSSGEMAIVAPSATWYFAEGSTAGGFDVFYLLANPGTTSARVGARFLLPSGAVIGREYEIPAASRLTVWANVDPDLASTDMSAVFEVTSGPPIVAERSMYLSRGDRRFLAGHTASGVTAPSTDWTFAEGATGPYFDLFLLLGNPNLTPAEVDVTFLMPDGHTAQKHYSLAPTSRFNIWVDQERFDGVPILADTAVSMTVRATNGVPILAERAMWWPGPFAAWEEGHASAGATTTGPRWLVPWLGPFFADNYLLVANRSASGGRLRVTPLSGSEGPPQAPPAPKEYVMPATSRLTLSFSNEFLGLGPFGALVEALDPIELVVERSTYVEGGSGTLPTTRWARGSNLFGERVP